MNLDIDLYTSPLFILKKMQRDKIRESSEYLRGNVLDVGSGAQPYREYIKSISSYIGLDQSERVKPDICGQSTHIPFKENYFDSVICTEVLEHLKEPERCLSEIKRVLKKEGYLYITAPQCWGLHYEPDDYWRFTKHSLAYLIKRSGLELIKTERIGGIFSMVGVRLADVYYTIIKKTFFFLPIKQAERIAAVLTFPVSILFFCVGSLFDGIDERDALGWMILARKK